MEQQKSIFDQFNGFLDNVGVTFSKGIETTNNVLNNLAAYELAKSQREAAQHVSYTDKYLQPSQYNDVSLSASEWANPSGGLTIDRNILTIAILGIGVLAIYKIVK